ncbi:MAG: carboxypeptidase-like regulatory domain-containing protein, partial [Planctomycetota bacterium]|nr:carboxypeptidase-like regulatory domain-containing protein [Planctomycetota bacterium]
MVKTSMLLSLFFFLGALLGAFAGYQLGSSPRLDPPGSELSRAEPRQAAPPEKLPDAVRAPSRPREAAGAARAERAEAYHRVEETLREIPTPPAARGSARISGRVLGEDETPLGGVVVRATAVRDDPGRESAAAWNPDGVSRAAAVLDLIVAYDWERATTRTAETDASGSYVLENLLAEQRYTLEARKEGWKARPAPGQPSEDVKPGGNLDFVAERVVKIPVQLSLEDGETPHRGRIDWKKGRRQGSESWRAQDAAVELRPGTYRLTARSGEHNEYASEEQEVEVTATETPAALTFVLRPRPGIRGRLLFPPGEQPSGTLVHALHYAGEEPPAPEQLPTSGSRAWARERDGYRFTFHDLEEGAYLVGASRGSEVVATQVVRVTDGLAEAEIAIPSLARDEYVVVLVYGPGGEILKDANISGCGDVIRRPDGSAWIIPDPRRTRGDSCQIYVSSARYGSQRAQVSLPNDEEVAIHFEEPAHLDVAIAGYRGSGLEGRLSLKLRPATTGSRSGYVGRGGGVGYAGYPGFAGTSRSRGLDAEGRQSFGPVVPGD